MKKWLAETLHRENFKSIWITSGPLAVLFGFLLSFGMSCERKGAVDFSSLSLWLITLLFIVVSEVVLCVIWIMLDVYSGREEHPFKFALPQKNAWLVIAFIGLVVLYTITFLATYPGFFTYDATMTYYEVSNFRLNNQHPLIYVLLLGKACDYSIKHWGNANYGIAIYIYSQMLCVATCFTYVLYKMRKKNISDYVVFISFLYYALFPVIHMFALCSTKDTMFTTMMVLVMTLLWDCTDEPKQFFKSPIRCILLVIAITGFLILRKNALYAFVLFLPVAVIVLRKYWWKLGIILVAVSLLLALYEGPFTHRYQVEDIGSREMLSVPSQQLARVYNERPEVFTDEEMQLLLTFYPKEYLKLYLPKLSDHVKNNLNEYQYANNKEAYYRLWFSIGKKAPDIYINAFLINTYGFWYPFATIDGYKGYIGMMGTELEDATTSYFNDVVESPGVRESKIPFLNDFFFAISTEDFAQKIPFVSLLFSPGFMFLLMLIGIFYNIHRKNKSYVLMFLLMGMVWLSVQFGPIAIVRYVLFLFFGFPLLLSSLLFRKAAIAEASSPKTGSIIQDNEEKEPTEV